MELLWTSSQLARHSWAKSIKIHDDDGYQWLLMVLLMDDDDDDDDDDYDDDQNFINTFCV